MALITGYSRCTEPATVDEGAEHPRRCPLPGVGGLCSLHRERAQARFVEQWREAHPDEVYDPPWICPLCGQAVQRFTTAYPSEHEAHTQRWIEYHQRDHGDDWTAYTALAAEQQRP